MFETFFNLPFLIIKYVSSFFLFLFFFGQFFTTKPYACEPSSLPKYPPSKEMDAKLRDEEARRWLTTVNLISDCAYHQVWHQLNPQCSCLLTFIKLAGFLVKCQKLMNNVH